MPHAASPSPEPQPTDFPNTPLFVNDGPLLAAGQLKPSSPNLPLDELRRRYETDGYLFLKGVIPRADVLKAREQYFEFISPSGVLKPDTAPVDGIFDASKDKDKFPGLGAGAVGGNARPGDHTATFIDRALEAHYQDWYRDEFCKHPALHDFVARFSGWGDNTLGVRRTLLRNNIPGTKAIGVHYDQIFLRYGEPTSVTAWVPMGDIDVQGGGLIYLENGHVLGKELEDEFTTKARDSGFTDEEAKYAFNRNMMSSGMLDEGPARWAKKYNKRWLVSAYEAGDVVLHTPYTIHASTINHDPNDVIRLATDLRFVDSSKEWDKRWAKSYAFNDGA
ncbi:hypothetical protein H2201_003063 [Coniosporium apollinis]|uniref:Phytanoyl-CoA hydroxylase n=1 Tax=Coniosporium apollinis TaxID=61459 RepID=A0ABQ9NX14_9PEZI|nr:hypothetical protein H2201_003063 [Coniosporium apollinis]